MNRTRLRLSTLLAATLVYQRANLYDSVDWKGRAEGQPFCAQFQLPGGKLRNIANAYEEVKAGLDDLLDMAVYVAKIWRTNPEQAAIIEANIAIMKRWRSEGK